MRLIRVLVTDDQLDSVVDALDEEGFDVVRQRAWRDGEEQWLVEAPVPTDAVGFVLDLLREADVDPEQYTVVGELDVAMAPNSEALQERFATDFDPLTRHELRSKADDISHDARSFLSLIVLSAVIATAGLLVDSPAVVVGSMVIAPIVGPVLTTSVGALTGDGEMLRHSVSLQAAGLATAMIGAAAFGVAVKEAGFVPATLDVASIELITLRIAPTALTVVVGLAAGGAAGFGIATKGPTSLIGVMIAAALIPAAATVGIAVAWNAPRIAAGSLVLVVLTMIAINVGTAAVLRALGYRADSEWHPLPASGTYRALALAGLVALALLVAGIGAASAQQVVYERAVDEQVEATLAQPTYAALEPIAVRVQYGGPLPWGSTETVTVTVSQSGGGQPPPVADAVDRRISNATDRDPRVRVRLVSYQWENESNASAIASSGRKPADGVDHSVAVTGSAARLLTPNSI